MTRASETAQSIDLLRSLRSVRRFTSEPVSQQALDDILAVLRWSGSSGNRQTWHAIVVRDRELLHGLAKLEGYARHLAGAALGIVLVSAGEAAENEAFDEGRLSERIMLAAAAHGLGSSIGWFVGRGREQAKQLLSAPAERVVRTAVSIGHPAEARGGRRKPLQELVSCDRFGER